MAEKRWGISLSGKPDEHRVKAGKTGLASIPVSWAMATTGKPGQNRCQTCPILGVINVEEVCPASIGNDKHGKAPVLVVQSTISGHQTLRLSTAWPYE